MVAADDLKKQLTSGPQAVSKELADCIVDGLVAAGVPLDKYKDPSPTDQMKLTDTVTACVLKSGPQGVS